MSLRFVPPQTEQEKLPRYASYSAGIMKNHSSVGHAKNSLNHRMWTWDTPTDGGKRQRVTKHSFILEMIDGQYFTLYEIKPGLTWEHLPWMKLGFRSAWGNWTELTDYYLNSSYYGPKLEKGELTKSYRAVPMTRDEYVDFRIKADRELRGVAE